jgi:hypothetical protein
VSEPSSDPPAPPASNDPDAPTTTPVDAPAPAPAEPAASSEATASAAPAPAATPAQSAAPAAPEPAPLSLEAVRKFLAWCQEHPEDPEALPLLNELGEHLHNPELAAGLVAAARAVTRPLLATDPLPPTAHAHMIVLLAWLLQIDSQRDPVDALYVEWLRHPGSFGHGHLTPPALQRSEFVQRLGDVLGWGLLDPQRDLSALERFAAWVNTWTMKNKYRVRRTIDALRRNFPAPEAWRLIRFAQG